MCLELSYRRDVCFCMFFVGSLGNASDAVDIYIYTYMYLVL